MYCCYHSKASPLSFYSVTSRPYPLLRPFGYGQETGQLTFKLKQAGMLENSGPMRYNYLFIKHGLVLVEMGIWGHFTKVSDV